MLCVKCQKRPAVVFVQRLENGKTVQEGYCLTCARAMHIQPVDDLMKQFARFFFANTKKAVSFWTPACWPP